MAEPTGMHHARARTITGSMLGAALGLAAAAATAGPPEAAPLPGVEWTDPDSVNWTDSPTAVKPQPDGGRWLGRRLESKAEPSAPQPTAGGFGGGRLLGRLRSEMRIARGQDHPPTGDPEHAGAAAEIESDPSGWPHPTRLVEQIQRLAASAPDDTAHGSAIDAWAARSLDDLRRVLDTAGPAASSAAAALLPLGDDVEAGMSLADGVPEAALASDTRRAALAVARRVAVWRAAAATCAAAAEPLPDSSDVAAKLASGRVHIDAVRLIAALERFESTPTTTVAGLAATPLAALAARHGAAPQSLVRAVHEHYLAPNVRVAVHHHFVARLLPEATVKRGPLQDFVLGRPVRGTSTVEQSTEIRFIPDAEKIRLELLVNGEVTSRTVTDAGAVAFHSRGEANFVVRKPVVVSAGGISFGTALGTASNQSQLAEIETSFDSVPIMGSLVRNIARNQHAERRGEATREVNDRIVTKACREVDAQAEPQFSQMAERIRERIWEPLVRLGLEPTPIALETTSALATARLRLAGAGQLAAHTPRPRAPADALLSLQVHESSVNNACDRLGLAGRRMRLEELISSLCERLGIAARLPDDLPEDVAVTFAARQPLRIECREGLVHVYVALDALESGRRNWYDIVAHVAYRPSGTGAQVLLEREGPVQLSGAGQQGRMELALRAVFGKVFAKERPVRILPDSIASHPRLVDVRTTQAVSADGWFALALSETAPPAPATQADRPAEPARRLLRR